MAGKNVIGTQKEVTAVIVNLKEGRILDKAVHTLSLEESYATKLLELNCKMVKFHFGRLKNNVGKIKSNLQPADIAAMRTLEVQGRFRPETASVQSSNNSKISAAAKRLKLNNTRRSSSAMPRMQGNMKKPPKCNMEAVKEEDSDSVKEKLKQRINRRGSIMSDHSEVASVLCKTVRPHTSVDQIPPRSPRTTEGRPSSPRPNTAAILEKIASAQKARKSRTHQTIYSCHDDLGGSKSANGSINSDVFGPNPYEIRRRKLLESENHNSAALSKRRTYFMKETSKFVEQNPIVSKYNPETTQEVIQSIDSMAKRPGMTVRARSARSGKSLADRVDNALLRQFAEIRKTRYLRVDEKLLDNSGVNTLAKDHHRMTESWRNVANKARVSFAAAAAL